MTQSSLFSSSTSSTISSTDVSSSVFNTFFKPSSPFSAMLIVVILTFLIVSLTSGFSRNSLIPFPISFTTSLAFLNRSDSLILSNSAAVLGINICSEYIYLEVYMIKERIKIIIFQNYREYYIKTIFLDQQFTINLLCH